MLSPGTRLCEQHCCGLLLREQERKPVSREFKVVTNKHRHTLHCELKRVHWNASHSIKPHHCHTHLPKHTEGYESPQ